MFYHSHPGLSMGSEQADADFASAMCNNFQWATLLAAEQVPPPTMSRRELQRGCMSSCVLCRPGVGSGLADFGQL